jgi:3-oxoacyl-[acyl-carrier-protein] synthase III
MSSPTPTPSAPSAHLTGWGSFLPGAPVGNDEVEQRLGQIGHVPSALREPVLARNGIRTRHYALDEDGRPSMLNEQLAERAVRAALAERGVDAGAVGMLAVGTTQGDLLVPGFASQVHGRLGGGPAEVLSVGGVCAASIGALAGAVRAVRCGDHALAVAAASETPSRVLRAERFAAYDQGDCPEARRARADAEFLRWMLSDGAGAVVVEPAPRADGPSLRVDWIASASHAHERPLCMFAGTSLTDPSDLAAGSTWLDQPDAAGAVNLRQDVRRLRGLVELGVATYRQLVDDGRIDEDAVDVVIAHLSSAAFLVQTDAELARTGCRIRRDRFWSNLATRGNTGSASIYVALDEAMRTGVVRPGQRALLMVPESGRSQIAFVHLTCVGPEEIAVSGREVAGAVVAAPEAATEPDAPLARVQAGLDAVRRELADDLAAVPLVRRLESGTTTIGDYRALLWHLRQQVALGTSWIARAASRFGPDHADVRAVALGHAAAEQGDFRLLEHDHVACGGTLAEIQGGAPNAGTRALAAYVASEADQPDPWGVLGAMAVIEWLGAHRTGPWRDAFVAQLGLAPDQVTFLAHHARADEDHVATLDLLLAEACRRSPDAADRIVDVARTVARCYVLQLAEIERSPEGRS